MTYEERLTADIIGCVIQAEGYSEVIWCNLTLAHERVRENIPLSSTIDSASAGSNSKCTCAAVTSSASVPSCGALAILRMNLRRVGCEDVASVRVVG